MNQHMLHKKVVSTTLLVAFMILVSDPLLAGTNEGHGASRGAVATPDVIETPASITTSQKQAPPANLAGVGRSATTSVANVADAKPNSLATPAPAANQPTMEGKKPSRAQRGGGLSGITLSVLVFGFLYCAVWLRSVDVRLKKMIQAQTNMATPAGSATSEEIQKIRQDISRCVRDAMRTEIERLSPSEATSADAEVVSKTTEARIERMDTELGELREKQKAVEADKADLEDARQALQAARVELAQREKAAQAALETERREFQAKANDVASREESFASQIRDCTHKLNAAQAETDSLQSALGALGVEMLNQWKGRIQDANAIALSLAVVVHEVDGGEDRRRAAFQRLDSLMHACLAKSPDMLLELRQDVETRINHAMGGNFIVQWPHPGEAYDERQHNRMTAMGGVIKSALTAVIKDSAGTVIVPARVMTE